MNNGELKRIKELSQISKEPNLDKGQEIRQGTNIPNKTKIIGNYLLGKNIGEGTFGKVHLAMHLPTNQKVAIKIIDKSKIQNKDIERVKCQIQILTVTRHRHIIHMYEVIQTQKSLLLVMEHMPNGQLFHQIIKDKKFSQADACVYFQQIISAIQYLHNNKITHRDIKPENILIDYDRQLKIIDFGLSAFFDKGQLKSFCGSPCYAAPQIINAKKGYNPIQADLWSCGIILFIMLSGHLPFCDSNSHSLYEKILTCNYKMPNFISSSAKDLIQNLLVLNPSKRLTLQQIKNHEWFNRIVPSPAYGLIKQQRIVPNSSILNRLAILGIQQAKVVQSLWKNQKNKFTASYYILMKMIAKTEIVEHYIGNNNFDQKQIVIAQLKQDETSLESPVATVVQKTPSVEAPKDIENNQDVQVGQTAPQQQWWKGINNQQLIQFKETAITAEERISTLKQFLSPVQNKNMLTENQILFYSNNLDNRKKKVDIHEHYIQFHQEQPQMKSKKKKFQFTSKNKHHIQWILKVYSPIDYHKTKNRENPNMTQHIRSISKKLPSFLPKIEPKSTVVITKRQRWNSKSMELRDGQYHQKHYQKH